MVMEPIIGVFETDIIFSAARYQDASNGFGGLKPAPPRRIGASGGAGFSPPCGENGQSPVIEHHFSHP
jgi:hypothetical protein